MTKEFLTKGQQKKLSDKKWDVVPHGKYLTLYREDFGNNNAWQEICQQLDISPKTEEVDILFFGVQSNH